MRIAFLFNYPLADNTPWKQRLIRTLRPDHELFVVFGKTQPVDYYRGYLRRRQEDNVPQLGPAPQATERKRRTVDVLKELRVPIAKVQNVNDVACEKALLDFKPDFVVTALDQLFSKERIGNLPIVLNTHYGVLPEVKGWNATEWSLLVTGRLSVSLHRVVWPVDSGEIYITRDIEVLPSDDFHSLYLKCQDSAYEMYARFFSDPDRHVREARPNGPGKTYYVMNRQLKRQIAEMIRAGRFSPEGGGAPSTDVR
jgi:folate-dependent phosphoribosylglycinamide formyltransferase PurN